MRKRINESPEARKILDSILDSDRQEGANLSQGFICPYCLAPTAEEAIGNVCLWTCKDHGLMRRANTLTTVFLAKANPALFALPDIEWAQMLRNAVNATQNQEVLVALYAAAEIGGIRLQGRHVSVCDECIKKDAEILSLRKQLAEGIHLRGWWCNAPIVTVMGVKTTCDRFNGEEKDETISCRYCGALKGTPYQPGFGANDSREKEG